MAAFAFEKLKTPVNPRLSMESAHIKAALVYASHDIATALHLIIPSLSRHDPLGWKPALGAAHL